MNGKTYWLQQLPRLALHLVCMSAFALFLWANGNTYDCVLLLSAVWLVVFAACSWFAYRRRKATLDRLLTLAERLEERYLIHEVMQPPGRADDWVYYRILKLAGRSMLEEIEAIRRERLEYKDQIEQWVHEIKTPITAMKLLCENNRSELTTALLVELEKTDRFTEQALYYARSEHTEKDHFVQELELSDAIHQAIAENKYLLLQNGVRIELLDTSAVVYSDGKWICFILSQLIANAVKYRSEQPTIRFYTERQGSETVLCVQDNGIGIAASDLPRIFEKGFTGQNGRNAAQNATGIGLYLCKRLCDKLGIGLRADSVEGQGATLRLSFHVNDFIHPMQG